MKILTLNQYLQQNSLISNFKKDDHRFASLAQIILTHASNVNASDIHIQVKPDGYSRILYRINQELVPQLTLSPDLHQKLSLRLKYLAKIDPTEGRNIQEGSFEFKHRQEDISVRYSAIPTNNGQKIVMRLFKQSTYNRDLKSLGFDSEGLNLYRSMIRQKSGLILITGGTGSGKSTTAFSTLKEITSTSRCAISIEDPQEVSLPFLTQFDISRIGESFSTILSMSLRQDPDIIFLGEIRDSESAKAAVAAGNTGHLVISTLHAKSVFSVPERLIELGVDPVLLSDTLIGVVSQKLARTLCPRCKTKTSSYNWWYAPGCNSCFQSGFSGQTAVTEVLPTNELFIRLCLRNKQEARMLALSEGWRPSVISLSEKVKKGLISPLEAARVMKNELI